VVGLLVIGLVRTVRRRRGRAAAETPADDTAENGQR